MHCIHSVFRRTLNCNIFTYANPDFLVALWTLYFAVGYEVERYNNMVGASTTANLAPQSKHELQPPESARSTLSGRSWLTDDKWSDEDDDDVDEIASKAAAVTASVVPKSPAGKVAPPVGVLGSQSASENALQQVKCTLIQTFSCNMYN